LCTTPPAIFFCVMGLGLMNRERDAPDL
jgi:hypothetical protein